MAQRVLPALLRVVVFIVALTALPAAASANHGARELLSVGPSGGNAATPAVFTGASRDGARVFFQTNESLVPADGDTATDVYQRSSGTTSLLSIGPTGGNGSQNAFFAGASEDGTRVFFGTTEKLVGSDTDTSTDIYERNAGVTTLISTGPSGGNGSFNASFDAASADGTRVFFHTTEKLVSADTDNRVDIYERSGGVTALVSIGPAGGNGAFSASFAGASRDGTRVFFETSESLVLGDTDAFQDVYQRAGTTTTQVSTGPPGGNGAFDAFFDGASEDGTSILFSSAESLAVGDTDADYFDVYQRSGGATTLVSTGPGAGGAFDAFYAGASADAAKIFFETEEKLSGADSDSNLDVYERSGGTTTLVSTGPGAGGAFDAFFDGASRDGARVFFDTDEALTASDSDSSIDVFERAAGVTTHLSTGPAGGNGSFDAAFAGASEDGVRAFFTTAEPLVGGDSDASTDVYERFSGATTLLSNGPAGGNGAFNAAFVGSSADGAIVFLATQEKLVAGDGDSAQDVYAAEVAYGVPASAASVRVSLVPAFRQCGTSANPVDGAHAPPLVTAACRPPVTTSTVAHFGAQSTGSASIAARPGNAGTVADEADIEFDVDMTDIRAGGPAGGDYNPSASGADLTLATRLRLTDLSNGPSGSEPGTTTDFDFLVPVACTATASTTIGSTCAADTTADALMPGAVTEAKSTVVDAFRLRVTDAGPNGVRGDGDDTLLAQQGIYIP